MHRARTGCCPVTHVPDRSNVWQIVANICHTVARRSDSSPTEGNDTLTANEAVRMARPRLAWTVLGVGVIAYVLTVMQRTSLGVAGLDAAQRFEINPGALSAFVFIQVAVYVMALIPAGLLVDRYGARLMLVVSGVLLTAGQLLLAFTAALPAAVPARILVGMGDAIVFSAVLALIPRWFPPRRVPLIAQGSTILGQLGQILSAVPFALLLHGAGWSVAFGTAAAGSALVAVLVLAVVRNGPGQSWQPAASVSARQIAGQLRAVWNRPGTRLGFFGHMGTQFSMMVFALLWGVPYLVSGQHLSPSTAGALIMLFVFCSVVLGPVIGLLTTRHPMRRSWMLLGIIAANVTHLDGRAHPARTRAAVAAGRPGRGAVRRGSGLDGRISTSAGPPTPVRASASRRAWSTSAASWRPCSCWPRWG